MFWTFYRYFQYQHFLQLAIDVNHQHSLIMLIENAPIAIMLPTKTYLYLYVCSYRKTEFLGDSQKPAFCNQDRRLKKLSFGGFLQMV